jgi:tetratricopeptide (TPR) repeat protein
MKDRLKVQQEFFSRIAETSARLLSDTDNMTPDSAEYHRNRGLAAYVLTEYKIARDHLTAAFMLETSADTAARLSMCYWRLNELIQAAEWIDKALALDPNGVLIPNILSTRPTYRAISAGIQFQLGNIDLAFQLADVALKHEAHDIVALSVLTNVNLLRGEIDEALALADKGASLSTEESLSQIDFLGTRELLKGIQSANVTSTPFVSSFAIVASNAA